MPRALPRDPTEVIETLELTAWPCVGETVPLHNRRPFAIDALEAGKVVFLPQLPFALKPGEEKFLDPATVSPKAKNVSFDPKTGMAKHAQGGADDTAAMTAMLRRYAEHAIALVKGLFPHYCDALETGRTSFRPVEIAGRPVSLRQDDTLLHVDAFPTSPVAEKRIMRVFSNVNPEGKTRHWRLGEPFPEVADRFFRHAGQPVPGSAWALKRLGLTKARRTAYDHFMLHIHDAMKRDDAYQAKVAQNEFHFPPGSTWIVFTDCTSHAAMAGQHMFEQTLYLPISAMANEEKSPQRVLERLAGRALI